MRRQSLKRYFMVCALALVSSAAGAPATAVAAPAPTTTPALAPARAAAPSRWIAVSVATLWVAARTARALDRPALAVPADPRGWVAAMTTAQKYWLCGKLETQALYGTRVYLLGTSGSWAHVAVAGQPTPRNARGYPGWLPSSQLTATAPKAGPRIAVVRRPAVWLYADGGLSARVMEISYATRVPAAAWTSAAVEVVMLDGRHLYLPRAAVALHTAGTLRPALSGAALVREAKRFLGLGYLWGGTSGFAFDCSGFTHTLHSALGKTIPRDADAQSARGRRIAARGDLRPGDLVFFRNASGYVHHVGMYVGGGRFIHSPRTGRAVEIASLAAQPYASEFAGGRRYATAP